MFGPLVIAPLSELYGRRIIFNITNIAFLGFIIGNARSTNVGEFIAFRFLSGMMGSTPLTVCASVAPTTFPLFANCKNQIGGGVIADLMRQEKRGGAMAIWAMGPISMFYTAPIRNNQEGN